MLRQNLGASQARSAGGTAIDTVDEFMDNSEPFFTNFVRSSVPNLSISDGSSGKVEFETKKATYTGENSVNYTTNMGAQWLGDTELMITTACESDIWDSSQTSINEFIDKTSIVAI